MSDISYTRTTWADGSEGGTPIDSTKLNNIEQGIVDAVAAIGPNDTTADGTLKAQIDDISTSLASVREVVKNDPSGVRLYKESDGGQYIHVTLLQFGIASNSPYCQFLYGQKQPGGSTQWITVKDLI